MQYIDIFFLLITLALGFVLYTRLGRRTGHEKSAMSFVETLNTAEDDAPPSENYALLSVDPSDMMAIQKIQKHDKKFVIESFIDKVKNAFEKILKGFVSGDQVVLSAFMTPAFLKRYEPQLTALKKKKISTKLEFFRLISAQIHRVHATDTEVNIQVHFVSEQTQVRVNEKGKVIEGDINFIDQISELWTFTRLLKSRGPWMLSGIDPYEAS